MTIESVANSLKEVSQLFQCTHEIAWMNYMHPAITEKFTYEEVMKCIQVEEGDNQ